MKKLSLFIFLLEYKNFPFPYPSMIFLTISSTLIFIPEQKLKVPTAFLNINLSKEFEKKSGVIKSLNVDDSKFNNILFFSLRLCNAL